MALPRYESITNSNYYLDVIYKIWNALQPLVVLMPDRDSNLSNLPVKNIELNPVIIDRIDTTQGPQIYVSMDSSDSANDLEGTFGTFIELLRIRLELFVGENNDNIELTEESCKLLKDLQYVLNPQDFIGAPLSTSQSAMVNIVDNQTISSSITVADNLSSYSNEIRLMVELQNGVLSDNNIPAAIRVNGENSSGTTFSEYFFYNRSDLNTTRFSNHKFDQITSVSSDGFSGGKITIQAQIGEQSREAQIIDAGILTWGFDERTRGTPKEVLVLIFQTELHHFLPKTITFNTI